jgi:hypothetical protein
MDENIVRKVGKKYRIHCVRSNKMKLNKMERNGNKINKAGKKYKGRKKQRQENYLEKGLAIKLKMGKEI